MASRGQDIWPQGERHCTNSCHSCWRHWYHLRLRHTCHVPLGFIVGAPAAGHRKAHCARYLRCVLRRLLCHSPQKILHFETKIGVPNTYWCVVVYMSVFRPLMLALLRYCAATAYTIRSLHSIGGEIAARKKALMLGRSFVAAFCYKVVSGYAPGIMWDWHIGWTRTLLHSYKCLMDSTLSGFTFNSVPPGFHQHHSSRELGLVD